MGIVPLKHQIDIAHKAVQTAENLGTLVMRYLRLIVLGIIVCIIVCKSHDAPLKIL